MKANENQVKIIDCIIKLLDDWKNNENIDCSNHIDDIYSSLFENLENEFIISCTEKEYIAEYLCCILDIIKDF